MRADLSKLRAPNRAILDSTIKEMMQVSVDRNDPIYISDLIGSQWGELLLRALREEPERKYRLFCIRDKFGNPLKPGDKVLRRYKKSLMRDGMPIPSTELDEKVINGTWEKDMHRFEPFTVDERGCITVDAKDAEHFLSHYGVHGKSKDRRLSCSRKCGSRYPDSANQR